MFYPAELKTLRTGLVSETTAAFQPSDFSFLQMLLLIVSTHLYMQHTLTWDLTFHHNVNVVGPLLICLYCRYTVGQHSFFFIRPTEHSLDI